jgi:hypothetical protein
MARLVIVWNRDKPQYELSVKGFSVTRPSERECLELAIGALERCLAQTKKQLESPKEKE